MAETIFIGADHAGVGLKGQIAQALAKEFPELKVVDLGTEGEASVHYPNFAEKVAVEVGQGKGRGILVCGSGIGMTISANKVDGVRAAQCWDATSARLSREHNDANIICLGARLTGPEVALEAVRTWLKTKFMGGRHQERVDLIRGLEKK